MTFMEAVVYVTVGAIVGGGLVACTPVLILVIVGACIPCLMAATSTKEMGTGSFTSPVVSELQSASSAPLSVMGGCWCISVLVGAAVGAALGAFLYF